MTLQFATLILTVSGALANGSLPFMLFINPAHMNRAWTLQRTSEEPRDIDLVNSDGLRIGRATVSVQGKQCHVRIQSATLPNGNYRAHLANSAKCFETRAPGTAGELIDSASFSVTTNDTLTPSSFRFTSSGTADALGKMMAKHGLVIQIVEPGTPAPLACGHLSVIE